MGPKKPRVQPLDVRCSLTYPLCARDPNEVLQRLRKNATAAILQAQPPPPIPVPVSVKIVTLLSSIVTVIIILVNPFSHWFIVTHRGCTANAGLWKIYITDTPDCNFLSMTLSFSDYIMVPRVLITIVGIQSFLTTAGLVWYWLRKQHFVILQSAVDATGNTTILLICATITVAVAEGRRFTQVSEYPAYGPTFFVFVTGTVVSLFNFLIFCVIFDWDEPDDAED